MDHTGTPPDLWAKRSIEQERQSKYELGFGKSEAPLLQVNRSVPQSGE